MGDSPPAADPDVDVDIDADSAALAAAMGFTSFGARARPSKKRRFNPRADAAVATTTTTSGLGLGPAPPSLPPKPPAPTPASFTPGTAANRLPLHSRPARRGRGGGAPGTAAAAEGENADEIDLGEDDDEPAGDDGGDRLVGGEGDERDDGGGPQYTDTSRLPAPAPLDAEAGGASAHGQAPGLLPGHGQEPARGGWRGRGGGGGGRGGGARNPDWSVDYYDPSSNENPWGRLEAAKGLEPVGSWLDRRGGGVRSG